MTDLTTLVNIGPTLAADLRAVGVADVETFHALGVEECATRLERAGLRDCTNARHALERAAERRRWTVGH